MSNAAYAGTPHDALATFLIHNVVSQLQLQFSIATRICIASPTVLDGSASQAKSSG